MSDPSKYYVDPNFANPHGPNDAPLIIYGYRPPAPPLTPPSLPRPPPFFLPPH